MADAWELLHGLSPSDNMDFRTTMNGGYEAIEVYINELADSLSAFGKWPAYLTAVEGPSLGRRSMAFTAAPNPFKAKTRIVFAGGFGPEAKPDLQILDLKGRVIEQASTAHYAWAPRNRPAGIYIARMRVQGRTFITPLFLLK
jgi:hypothetical protein